MLYSSNVRVFCLGKMIQRDYTQKCDNVCFAISNNRSLHRNCDPDRQVTHLPCIWYAEVVSLTFDLSTGQILGMWHFVGQHFHVSWLYAYQFRRSWSLSIVQRLWPLHLEMAKVQFLPFFAKVFELSISQTLFLGILFARFTVTY